MQSDSDRVLQDDDGGGVADFPAPPWVNYVLFGLVFAGAVAGMAGMGYLADRIGRRKVAACCLLFSRCAGVFFLLLRVILLVY
jgi:MFS family permease